MKEKVFLLGGYDLEMLEIKALLEEKGIKFFDKRLSWNNAMLNHYAEELELYGNKTDYQLYGIELRHNPTDELPTNYHSIDHHNEFDNEPSSLEQVCQILFHPMDRRQQLVAANDCGYIPAMKRINATESEIEEIRRQDRASQGVTAEDEEKAEKSIDKNRIEKGGVIVIKSLTDKFSTICDRLYGRKHLVIYNEKDLNYYGAGKNEIVKLLSEEFGKQNIYSGGGDNGFVGINAFGKRTNEVQKRILNLVVDKIKVMSYHIFYYPFSWKLEAKNQNGCKELFKVGSNSKNWEQASPSGTLCRKQDLYDEKNYFFPFVHSVLFDDGKYKKNKIMKHFKRVEPQQNEVEYHIEIRSKDKPKTYHLTVEAININLYNTGAGVLVIHTKNNRSDQFEPNDIALINQYGRRIFPPFYDDIEQRSEIANKLYLKGLEAKSPQKGGEYEEDFTQYSNAEPWEPAKFIRTLINDLDPELKTKPLVDDRMFVNCWYSNNYLSKKIKDTETNYFKWNSSLDSFLHGNDFWYRFLFIDGEEITCQNSLLKKELIDNSTYFRWQKYGTLIGITRYSFVMLTDESDFSNNVLAKHMRSLYSQMFELAIIQRISILIFSERANDITQGNLKKYREIIDKTSTLQHDYLQFLNQINFREVTPQDQGIDLYNMLTNAMQIKEYAKAMDHEIEELNHYVQLLDDKQRNKNALLLTVVATVFLFPTLIINILGLFDFTTSCKVLGVLISIIIGLAGAYIFYKNNK